MARGKRRYKNRKPFNKAQYKQVAKIANKQIHKASEMKTLDTYVGDINCRSTWVRTKMIYPSQSDDQDGRVGNSIYLKSFSLSAYADADTQQQMVQRMILVQQLSSDANAAAGGGENPISIEDILEYGDSSAPAANANQNLNSFYKKKPQKRFKVLFDSKYFYDSNVTNAPKDFQIRVNSRDFKIHKPDFSGNAVTTCTGALYLFTFGNTAASGSLNGVTTRLRYYDN